MKPINYLSSSCYYDLTYLIEPKRVGHPIPLQSERWSQLTPRQLKLLSQRAMVFGVYPKAPKGVMGFLGEGLGFGG